MNTYGQGLLEYGFIIILVAIVVMLVVLVFGDAVGNVYSGIVEALPFR